MPKIAIDEAVLKEAIRQHINPQAIELYHDYGIRSKGKEYSPYAQFFIDTESSKRIMATQGLPMVDAYDIKPELTWVSKGKKIYSRPNLFYSEINKKQVRLVCLSDQPYGAKKDDEVTWVPQLFIGGSEVHPLSNTPTLLETDPANQFLHYNVLEWDYGVCKRRLRLIQGMFREWWVFYQNPNKDIDIVHNQVGSLRLRLGIFGVSPDAKHISIQAFNDLVAENGGYPVSIGASATFYPDSGLGGVDGYVDVIDLGGRTWAAIISDAGTGAGDAGDNSWACGLRCDGITDRFRVNRKSIFTLDTSELDDAAIISDAVFTLHGADKTDHNGNAVDCCIYAANPVSNTALEAADYLSYSDTPFSDVITYAGFNTGTPGSPNDFTFVQAGKDAISKTSYTELGTQNANYDVAVNQPSWIAGEQIDKLDVWYTSKGVGYKPKLVVTYTVPGWSNIAKVMGVGQADILKFKGAAKDDIAKVKGAAV